MEKLDKYIVLNDLSARIMQEPMCTITLYDGSQHNNKLSIGIIEQFRQGNIITEVKPHLVPYNKMPKDLNDEIFKLITDKEQHMQVRLSKVFNLLLRHNIDLNSLVFKKLAIETPYTPPAKKEKE